MQVLFAGGEVPVEVSDGIGIAPEDVKRLFELFLRADGARARTTPGIELGHRTRASDSGCA